MEKEKIEKIPRKRIEVDVNKIKKDGDHFTHREITEINSGIEWYDFAFPVDLVNCETKVFVSIAERKGECATAEDAHFNKSKLFLSYCYYYFMNSSKKRIGTQSSIGSVECETNLNSFLSHSDYSIG
ncbi:MAG TPA: hypothetical protein VHJ38_14955 [Nitrososphaeraceae archaeon]|jgi:hypothetical protein|nr:hypothetical protein [Nitrososphaeraceae archaeon]